CVCPAQKPSFHSVRSTLTGLVTRRGGLSPAPSSPLLTGGFSRRHRSLHPQLALNRRVAGSGTGGASRSANYSSPCQRSILIPVSFRSDAQAGQPGGFKPRTSVRGG